MYVLAQKASDHPFKKASKIVVKNALSADDNFMAAGKSLIENGFLVGNKDEQFKQINSAPIKLSGGTQLIFFCSLRGPFMRWRNTSTSSV